MLLGRREKKREDVARGKREEIARGRVAGGGC